MRRCPAPRRSISPPPASGARRHLRRLHTLAPAVRPSVMVSQTPVGEVAAAAQAAAEIDWELMERWDRRYYLHNVQGQEEHQWNGVAYQDGNYLYMVDGTRLLDCQSQLISDNMGHRHPRVVEGLKAALERYGHVYFGMATDYRAKAAKLIVKDLLGGDG